MPRSIVKILAAVLAAQQLPVCAETLSLDCSAPISDREEQKHIQQFAKGVVARKSKRELQVSVNGNIIRFIDKPPYDEPEGTHYRFCDRKDGFILIAVDNGDLFSGNLINEATGQVTAGGERVVFSADKRAYFTSEQPDGLDGNVWSIYRIDGRRSWSGFSFIPRNGNPDYKSADLFNLKWQTNGELSAEANCAGQIDMNMKWKVKLVKIDGKWDWSPKRKCPEE